MLRASKARAPLAAILLVAVGASQAPSARSGDEPQDSSAASSTRRARAEPPTYGLLYEARLLPSKGLARVTIRAAEGGLLRELRFDVDGERHFRFEGDGEVKVTEGGVVWSVPTGGGALRYSVMVDHLREAAEYDARLTRRWALLRGSDLFPPSSSRTARAARSSARLELRVPPDWEVVTPFERDGDGGYRVEQGGRRLDRPSGWMLMGEELDGWSAEVAGVELTVAGPAGQGLRVRDLAALLRLALPELREVVGPLPERLVVVGADDPMWRGGLSGPGSLYLHSDRPLIESDGSSPLLHELIHVVTNAVSGEGGDWIVEGLAEYYSLQLLRRVGATSDEEYRRTLEGLAERASGADELGEGEASGGVTARGVVILSELDARIREASAGERSLDDVVRALAAEKRVVTPASFRAAVERAVGAEHADSLPGAD